MTNWGVVIFLITVLLAVLMIFISKNYEVQYSPVENILDYSDDKASVVLDDLNSEISCPGKADKIIVGYGVDFVKLADEVSRDDCLDIYSEISAERKTNSLIASKKRAIESCKNSIQKIEFVCGDFPCVDCQKNIGSSDCDDIHDNNIGPVSLAHAGGKGLCSMKSSASAWGKVPISCESETCS